MKAAAAMTLAALLVGLCAGGAAAEPFGRPFEEAAAQVKVLEGRRLLRIAQAALSAAARGEKLPDVEETEADREPAPFGVFVTAVRDRKVRGCYGRMQPGGGSLAAAVVDAAYGAARLDVRHTPIMPAELSELTIIVSLVGPTEPIEGTGSVDPMTMGLLVRSGTRSAVLLPGEARTARWQLKESRRKAGIGPNEPVQMFRFPTVTLIAKPGGEGAEKTEGDDQ